MQTPSRSFNILLAIAFLWGSSTAQMALLGVILQRHGMAPAAIATVFSSQTVTYIAVILIAGWLSSRWGPVRVMRLAGLFALAGTAALAFSLDQLSLAMAANVARGAAAACIMPTGQLFAQAQVVESDRARAVGMFSAMFLIPTFYSPALGEWLLAGVGEGGFFALALAPLAAATLLIRVLPQTAPAAPKDTKGYLGLLADRRLWLPNLAAAISGLSFAFSASFLPILLNERGVWVAWFFAPFAAGLMIMRFAGMKYLQRLAPPVVIGLGLAAYTAGFYMLLATGATPAFATGLCFAVGYGVMVPTAVVWSTAHISPDARARPIALIATVFQGGGLIGVQSAGATLSLLGWPGVLTLLGGIVGLALGAITVHLYVYRTTDLMSGRTAPVGDAQGRPGHARRR